MKAWRDCKVISVGRWQTRSTYSFEILPGIYDVQSAFSPSSQSSPMRVLNSASVKPGGSLRIKTLRRGAATLLVGFDAWFVLLFWDKGCMGSTPPDLVELADLAIVTGCLWGAGVAIVVAELWVPAVVDQRACKSMQYCPESDTILERDLTCAGHVCSARLVFSHNT